MPTRIPTYHVVSLSERCAHRNDALIPCLANRNPIGIGLLMPNLNRFSDYDNDNDCIRC